MEVKIKEFFNIKIKNPEKIAEIGQKIIRYSDECDVKKEKFYCICLNVKLQIIKIELISMGDLNSSIVHPREVFKPAILCSASAIVCFHNHPSGNVEASHNDIEVTKRLKSAGEILGIGLLDHLIITDENDGWVSVMK